MVKNWMIYFAISFTICMFVIPLHAVEAFRTVDDQRSFSRAPLRGYVPDQNHGSNSNQDTSSPAPTPGPVPDSGESINQPPQNTEGYVPSSRTTAQDRYSNAYVPRVSSPTENPTQTTPQEPPSSSSPAPQVPVAPSWLTSHEARAYELLNEFRIKNNLQPVQIHPQLVQLARLKAKDMIEKDYFSHTSPTYGSPGQMVRNAGVSCGLVGENLSKAGTIFQAHLQLEYSTQGHRQVMLNSRYDAVGIGVLPLQKTPGLLMVQIFIESR